MLSAHRFCGSAIVILLSLLRPADAQTPVPTSPAPAGSAAPAANSPPVGVSSGVPSPLPSAQGPLTLAAVVAAAVGNNSGLVAAQQRLQKAQELIAQVNAQGRPQIRADATDAYTSYNAFAPVLPTPAIANPTLPGGGQIPVVVDAGSSFSTAFVGGGGGGNAPSTGSVSPMSSGVTTGVTPATSGVSSPGLGVPSGTGAPGPVGNPGTTAPTNPEPTTSAPTNAAPNGGAGTPGQTAPGSLAPGSAAPGTPASAPGTPASAPGTPTSAPNTTTPSATPGNAPANAPAGTASPGQGAALPPIVASYVTETPNPTANLSSQSSVMEHPAEMEQPKDTTGGGGSGGTTGSVPTGLGSPVVGKRNNYAARASISQYIDIFGLLPAARETQEDVRDFYALDIERLQNETALAAKNLFFNLLFAQDLVDTQVEQVTDAQENVRITESRLRQGIVSRFDVLTAQTALSTAQQQLIAAQDQRDLAQADLSYLLGTDPDQPLTLQAPTLPPLDQTINLRQSIQTALAKRPEVRQAATNIAEARRLVKLAGSTLLPTLGVVGSVENTSTASQTAPRNYAVISAELGVPLDDGGATRSRVRSAQVDVQTQTLTLGQIQQSVSLEVREAALNVTNAQAQISSAQTGVAQSQEALRLAQERYQAGLGTFLDVLNALAQLARTRTNLSEADYFYQTSLAQLVRAIGSR